MPKAYILIGIPGSGKSTWIAHQPFDWDRTVIASSDSHIDRFAKEKGKTYSDVFKDYIKTATSLMDADVKHAIDNHLDIVWDQTNTSVGARAKKLKLLPNSYEKIAVVFSTPDDKELARRLASRPGKTIPPEIIASMKSQLQEPSESEGFDKIIYVK